MMNFINRILIKAPQWLIVAIAIIFIYFSAYLDFITGPYISVDFLYYFPIALITWYAFPKAGYVLSIIASSAIIGVNYSERYNNLHPFFAIWDGTLKIFTFWIVVYLIAKIKDSLAVEQNLARTDSLTGIPNRLTFLENLHRCFYQAERNKEPFTLAYVDVDNFKSINDTYGHEEGDTVLRLLAQTILGPLRRTDMAARLGGDEFALLLISTDSAGAKNLIDKVSSLLWTAFQSRSTEVTFSIGVVTFTKLPASVEDAIRIADAEMYKVKRCGKNSIGFSEFSQSPPGDY